MSYRNRPLTVSLLSSAVALATLSMPAFAQAPPRNPAGAAAASGKVGLNALDDEPVYYELDSRGLDDLLERAFKVNNVSEAQRKQILSARALNELLNKDLKDLNARQRRDIVQKLTGNLDKTLAPVKDPAKMVLLARKIEAIGVDNEVGLLEFWGEDPSTQAQLRPAAEAVLKLYANAETTLSKRMDDLSKGINGPDDPRLKEIDKLDQSRGNLQYSRMLQANYWVAISLDKADPRRAKLCDEAIEFLKQYDNEQSKEQWPLIRVQIGKLQMAKGDYGGALATLKSVKDTKPNTFQNNDAQISAAIAALLGKKPDEADKMLQETIAWQKTNLTEKADARQAADADAVLQARINWARAEAATDPAAKAKFNDQATVVLTQLMKDSPQYVPMINEQLINRLPANPDLTKLDTLLLQAIVGRGRSELNNDNPDKDRLTKAVAAGKELLRRKGQPGVDDKVVESTMIAIPLFAEKLGDNKAAATGFLDYVQNPKSDPSRRTAALDAAMNLLLGPLNAGTNPDVADLYDRAMPIAINAPFNHTELAYAYGRRMQRLKNTDDAIKYFRLVPANHPAALQAKYYLAIALNTKLDDPKLPASQRQQIATEIVKTAAEVDQAAVAGLAKATDDKQKNTFKAMLGGTKLTSAFVALDVQNNPKQALDILKDIETVVSGMPGGDNMVTDAMGVRIRAYIASGQDKEATALLLDFAKKRPNEAIGMVAQLNTRIGKEIDKAKAAGDTKRVAALAPTRATLTQFLADWIRNNPDPKIKAQTFAADSQLADVKREAALLEENPEKKKTQLKEVAKIYETLLASPQAQKDPGVSGALTAGLGLISFDTGDYQKCLDLINPLLRDRRLGSPYMFVNGEQVENSLYWEARYKVLRSYLEIGKQKGDQNAVKQVGDELRIIYSSTRNPGGQKWGAEFEKLRKEVDPTIDPNAAPLETTEPTTKKATDVD